MVYNWSDLMDDADFIISTMLYFTVAIHLAPSTAMSLDVPL